MATVKVDLFQRRILIFTVVLLILIPLTYTTKLLDNNSIHRLYLSIILFVLALQLTPLISKRPIININRKFILLSIALPSIYILSSLINNSTRLLLPDIFQILSYLSLSYIIIILFNILDLKKVINILAIALTVVSFTITVIGILQAINIHVLDILKINNLGSTLVSKIFAVEFIISSCPWVLIAFRAVNNKLVKMLSLFAFLVIIFYLFILRGRTGYLAMLVSTIFGLSYYLYHYRKHLSYKKNILTILIVGFLLIFIVRTSSKYHFNPQRPDIIKTISSALDLKHTDNQDRLSFWRASVKMFKSNPIFGIGTAKWAGAYPIYNGKAYNDGNIYRNFNINPHNDYLELLSEKGITTLICYILFILFPLIALLKKSKLKITFLFLTISMINILIASFFSFTQDRVAPMIIFYILIGIATFIATKESKNNYQIKPRTLCIILLLFVSMNTVFCVSRVYYEKIYIKGIEYKMEGQYANMLGYHEKINPYIYPFDPNYMPISYYKGVGYYALGDFDNALDEFTHAAYCRPESPLINNNLGSTYYSLNDINKAEYVFLQLKVNFPNYIEPQINLLAIYTNAGDNESAKELLKELENKTITNMVSNKMIYKNIQSYYENK